MVRMTVVGLRECYPRSEHTDLGHPQLLWDLWGGEEEGFAQECG